VLAIRRVLLRAVADSAGKRDEVIKICHLITSLDLGGAERALVNLVQRFPQSHFQNEVISLVEPGLFAEELRATGIPITSLDMPRGSPTISGLGRLVRHLRSTKPTILQTWLYHADLLGTVARTFVPGLRLVWNVRCSDMVAAPRSHKLNRVMRVLARLSRQPDAIVVNSASGKKFHENFGYSPRRWAEIGNGVDTMRFRPLPNMRNELRAKFSIAPQAYVIGMVARYHPMKDHPTFLRAAAAFVRQCPSAQFVLCGMGCDDKNTDLMQLVAEEGLLDRVVLLGIQRDLETVYPCFDLSTLTSSYGEGSPNALLEAMACGIPCVSTDVGDSRDILGECGVTMDSGNPGALAEAWMAMAIRDPALLAASARARAIDNHRIEQVCLEYEMLYREIALVPVDASLSRQAADRMDSLGETSLPN